VPKSAFTRRQATFRALLLKARQKAGSAIRFVEGDAASPDLPLGAFDVILCRHVLWTLPDPGAALAR
jgi:chemotaxis methyl-accepting protein methylase